VRAAQSYKHLHKCDARHAFRAFGTSAQMHWKGCISWIISALYSLALGAGNNKTIVSLTSRYWPEYVLTSAMRLKRTVVRVGMSRQENKESTRKKK
jgi:hypothetical protein